jgi:hypothetical protein
MLSWKLGLYTSCIRLILFRLNVYACTLPDKDDKNTDKNNDIVYTRLLYPNYIYCTDKDNNF